MSVPMAFSAQTGSLPITAGIVFLATLVWTLIYDTLYAMADRDEDIQIGVKSTAILFEKYDQIIITLLQISANFNFYSDGKYIQIRPNLLLFFNNYCYFHDLSSVFNEKTSK